MTPAFPTEHEPRGASIAATSFDQSQLSVEQSSDVSIVRVREAKLTYPVLSSFFTEVRHIVERGASKLVIDLEAVAYIDSPAIGCLMDIHRLLEDHGGALRLSGLRPRVGAIVSLTGVHKIVGVHRKEAEALAAFGPPTKQDGDWTSHVPSPSVAHSLARSTP